MSRWRWLAVLLCVALAFRLLFFTGLRGSDDLRYVALARDVAEGIPLITPETPLADVAVLRPAFTLPPALGVRLMGRTEAALLAYPMLCSLALVALLFLMAWRWLGPGAAVGAGLVAAALPGYVLAASSLYPDLPPTLWSTAAVFLLWAAPGLGARGHLAALASGLAFGLAVHHKETAVLLLPCLLLLAATPSRLRFLPGALAALAAWLWLAWDGYFPREVAAYVRLNLAPPADPRGAVYDPMLNPTLETTSTMTRRLLWDFTSMLVSPLKAGAFSMWGGVAWLAAGGAWLGFRQRSAPLMACTAWALLAFLALDFAGVPGPGYFPVHPVSPRYLALVMPPQVLLAGAFAAWAWARAGSRLRWGAALLGLAAALGMNAVTAAPNRPYGGTLRLAAGELRRAGAGEVWTDTRTASGLAFFLGGRVRLRELTEGARVPPGAYVVANGPMLHFMNAFYGHAIPSCVLSPPSHWECLARRQVQGFLGKGRGDPLRWSAVYRVVPAEAALARPPARPGGLLTAGPAGLQGITAHQRMVAVLMSVGLIVFIFELVRRRRLREEYSWLWMLAAAVILLFALYDPALGFITRLVGAVLPTSTLFFFGLFFLILICIHYAVKISTLTTQVKNLMQELALLRERLDREPKGKA